MKIVDTIMVCIDCLNYIEFGDEAEVDIAVKQAVEKLHDVGAPVPGCVNKEFSWSPCECCRSRLGGSRHEIAILGD